MADADGMTPEEFVGGRKSPPGGGLSPDEFAGAKPQSKGSDDPVVQFGKRSLGTAGRVGKGLVQHPLRMAVGAVKAVAGAASSMSELVEEGVAGSATAIYRGDLRGYLTGAEAVKKLNASLDRMMRTAGKLNVAPRNEQEQAAQDLLNVIPDGINALGDEAFKRTGSALAEAAVRGLATYMTLGLRGGPRGAELATKPVEAAKAKVTAAFDELSVKAPEKASVLADHVAANDPVIGKKLKVRYKSLQKATPEKQEIVGRDAAKAETPKAPGPTPEQATAALRDTTKELGQEASAPSIHVASLADEVGDAFGRLREVAQATPGLREVEGKLAQYTKQAIQAFSVESLGKGAEVAGSVIARANAEMAAKAAQLSRGSALRRSFWNARLTQVPEFLKKFESGAQIADPAVRQAAEGYRGWSESIYRQDLKTGFTYEPISHYMSHIFQDATGVADWAARTFGAKWKNPYFIKKRGFDLYAQAVAAGFKPKFTNPEDIMLARQHSSDVAEMQSAILADLEKWGFASREKEPPAGYETQRRSPTGQLYWVEKNANTVMHNAFDTFSLWNAKGIGGDAFRGLMAIKNTIVPIRLFSAFHVLHIGLALDNTSMFIRGAEELLTSTQPASAFAKLLKSFVPLKGPFWDNPKIGSRVLKAYTGRIPAEELTLADREGLLRMQEGGFVPLMSAEWKAGSVQKFTDALQAHQARAVFRLPGALIGALQRPIFEWWIPSLKAAAYLQDTASKLKIDPSLIDDPLKRQLTFRRVSQNIDERYGEMNYGNLFWPRWIKDTFVLNTLSLGWQKGVIGQFGGAVVDVAREASKGGSIAEKARAGSLSRPLFALGYTTMATSLTGLLSWSLSGQFPSGMDWIWPRSGDQNPDGSPKRLSTMFFTREFASIYQHAQQVGTLAAAEAVAASKASGVIGLAREAVTGVNSFGQEIRDPAGTTFQKVEQTVAYLFRDIEPIAVQRGAAGSARAKALAVAGFTPAPKYATETPTEARITTAYQKYVAPQETPYDRAQYSDELRSMRAAVGDDAKADQLRDQIKEKFDLSETDMRKLDKVGGVPAPLRMFARLPWQQQKELLDKMSEDEREIYLPHSNVKHLRRHYEAPEER